MGVTRNTVARWERGELRITRHAERSLSALSQIEFLDGAEKDTQRHYAPRIKELEAENERLLLQNARLMTQFVELKTRVAKKAIGVSDVKTAFSELFDEDDT